MTSGVGLSELLLILALIVIFVDAKQVPSLIRKSAKIVAQLRATVKKYIDDINIK